MTKELTQQELIRIYSAYLPYDLKIQTGSLSALNIKNHNMFGIVKKKEIISIINHSNTHIGFIEDCTPILYSMDMLTKEIEHEGRKFIPMNSFYREHHLKLKKELENTGGKLIMEFLPYGVIEKLLEWNFNIFNLDDSQYINKATLKTQ